ncbi:MAG: EAL domain-containing protein [Burkholderiales bacterium]|nr:EAL domain-containing protein [Burkholderiales bacterium]
MEGSEELRETLVAMRREIDLLRVEATHANLLLNALDSVLCVDGDADPFAGVFSALLPVFEYSHAIVLIENDHAQGTLECAAASRDSLVGSIWKAGRTFSKVLAGRIITTLSSADSEEWPDGIDVGLSQSQPALYLPLRVRNRRGLLMLLRDCDSSGFDRTHVALARKFSLLASHAFAATRANQTEAESHRLKQLTEQLKASQAELTFRANHDQLTGLPNRSHIQELVDAILMRKQPGQQLALAFIDLDNFKQVNDFYGHAAGDALLKRVADRVRAEIRKTDLIGRISGDEFVFILDPFREQAEVSALIARIRDRLQQPFEIDGARIRVSASIGVAFFPTHGSDYETLRRNADTAMYQAKTTSKGSIGFFNQTLGKEAAEKISLEHSLRTALRNRDFRYALQAKVDIRDQRIVGFEALARWVDAQGRVHPPGKFLALASELGLLDGITNIVLDALIDDLPRLDACFGTDVSYSINISAAQAAKIAFMEQFVQRIAGTGRAGSFTLELTEEAFVAAGPFQSRIFPLLREVGVGVSIDDFGTGYSSLSILADITADELKVDRSLITSIHQRPRSQSILRAIESLSAALSMYVVAEGIETVEERDFLLNATSITCGQGYLFHKPQFVDELIRSQTPTMPMPASGERFSSAHPSSRSPQSSALSF